MPTLSPSTDSPPQSAFGPAARPGPGGPSPLAAVNAILLLGSAVFLALHFLHLTADFPNHSPWMDWSKYTDEGWYGDAAIRHFQLGHWYIPGDFNPAAALPVWPFLEALLFRFTGVSLAAARALTVTVFAGILVSSYALVLRWHRLTHSTSQRLTLAPALGVLLLAISPFCFVFTRIAILEPLLVLLTLFAMLTASSMLPSQARARHLALSFLLGLLLTLMVLTKTTAVFLLPAVFFLLYARSRFRLRPFLRLTLPPALIAAGLWSAWFFLVVRPRFLADYRYLFSANAYTRITLDTAVSVLSSTILDGSWIGPILYPLAIFCAFASVLAFRRLHYNPLIVSLLLWAAGYTIFLAYHDNLQPRYFLVIAVPLTLLVPIVLEDLFIRPGLTPRPRLHQRVAAPAAAALITLIALRSATQTLSFVTHPEYTFLNAARQVRRIVSSDPSHSRLILSISGSDISLITGLPSICDDFGTMELPDRVAAYRPGWYVSWNQVDDDKMDALAPLFHLQRVAAFPAFDDPDRNLLILYRLDPPVAPSRPNRRRRLIPRRLQTRIGQQPSVNQLEH